MTTHHIKLLFGIFNNFVSISEIIWYLNKSKAQIMQIFWLAINMELAYTFQSINYHSSLNQHNKINIHKSIKLHRSIKYPIINSSNLNLIYIMESTIKAKDKVMALKFKSFSKIKIIQLFRKLYKWVIGKMMLKMDG